MLESKPIPEKKFSKTNIQESLPTTSQEKPQYAETHLEIKDSRKTDSVAKKSQEDDTLLIRKSIESGELVHIADDVRNLNLSYTNLIQTRYFI